MDKRVDKIEVSGKVISVNLVKLPDVDAYKNPAKGVNKKKRYHKLHLDIVIETNDEEKYSFRTPACLEQYLPIDNDKGFQIINGNRWFKNMRRFGSQIDDVKKAINIRKGDIIVVSAHRKTENELYYVHLLKHKSIFQK